VKLTKLFLALNILLALGLVGSFLAIRVSPDSIWFFAFLGLSFPFLLIGNLVFLLFWFFVRKKYLFLSLIAIIINLGTFNNYFNLSAKGSVLNNGNEEIKIMSYNVRLFDLYNWTENKKTRNNIFELLKEQDAGIYCFQEFFYQDKTKNSFETRDTMLLFLKSKNLHEEYSLNLRAGQHFGMATFSKYPIINKGKIIFENSKSNLCIYSDIKVYEDTIRVYNAHLASIRFNKDDYQFIGDEGNSKQYKNQVKKGQRIIGRLASAFKKRVSQTEKILHHIEESPYPVIVCGDFNDTPVSYCYSKFNAELNDAFKGSGNGIGNTYVGKLPPLLRIDYIFHSDDLHSFGYKRINEKLSDHYPITCKLQVRSGKEKMLEK